MTTVDTRVDERRLVLWSAADADDERAVRASVASAFPSVPTVVPEDSVPGPLRAAALASSTADLADARVRRVAETGPRPVVLMFPGQGSQHERMAAGLYGREPVFTSVIDEVFSQWGAMGAEIRSDWLSARDIDHVSRAQPLLFAVDYALGRTVLSWGVQPVALIGHSAGEVVASTLAGVFTLEEAVTLVRDRVEAAVEIPSGGMLAVAASVEEVTPYLVGDVAIAAVNSRRQVMLAGTDVPLEVTRGRLVADDFTVRTVPASTPFHCHAMDPAVFEAERNFRASPRAPRIPIYSGYTGELMTEEDAVSPFFWARQLSDTVFFGPALEKLLGDVDAVLVEAGPSQVLTAFARRVKSVRTGVSSVVPVLPASGGVPAVDRQSLYNVAAELWLEGHELHI